MFNGRSLMSIRILHNESRSQLAKILDVSEQAIWQYEQGIIEPQTINLLKLTRHFKVNLQYFLQEFDEKIHFSHNNLAYRLADDLNNRNIATEVEFLKHCGSIIRYLEEALISPPNKIVILRNKIMSRYLSTDNRDSSFFETIAQEARDYLNITDNEHLLSSLELSGIHIFEKPIIGKADAYSTWSSDNVAFIVLGSAKTAVRRNFDLAHELGHLLMHFEIDIQHLDKNQLKDIEHEANSFASCFLLPKNNICQDLNSLARYTNPDNYLPLKQKYYVSIQALEMRAFKLGYLNPKQHSYFYRQLHAKGYKKLEPLDKEMPYKRPTKIRYLFDLTLKNNLYSLDEILHHFGIRLGLLEELFLFEPDFLAPYKNSGTLPQKLYKIK